MGRVLTIVFPLVLVVLGGAYLYVSGAGAKLLDGLFGGKLVPVTGQVYLDGKAVGGAQIQTQIVGVDRPGATAFPDKDGKFDLKVQVNGDWVEGAYAGEHKVRVSILDMTHAVMGAPPAQLAPAKYQSFETTDLVFHVVPGEKNHWDLKITSEPRATPSGPAGRGGGGGGGPPRAPGPGPQPDPDAWVEQTLGRLDTDKNGELSREEAAAAPGQLPATLAGADGNRDGILSTEELKAVASQVLRLSQPRGDGGAPGRPPQESETGGGESSGGEPLAGESSAEESSAGGSSAGEEDASSESSP